MKSKAIENYVIASSKIWDPTMADRLQSVVGGTFSQVSEKSELSLEKLMLMNPRYIFFPHWSYMVPKEIYKKFECVIFHMTDLPYGRGGSPLQNLILRGHEDTVLCAIKCAQEVDSGPIYTRRDLSLAGSAQEIFVRASTKIEEMIVEIINGEPQPVEQVGMPIAFTRRKPEESRISGGASLNELYDFIRMLDAEGYPRAFVDIGNLRFEFKDAILNSESVSAEVVVRIHSVTEVE